MQQSSLTAPSSITLTKITKWQEALRSHIPIEQLGGEPEATPPYCPTWAGGKGTPPRNYELTFDELETVEEGYRNDSLRPHEAAILFGIPGSQIKSFLEKLDNVDIQPCPEWIPDWAHLLTMVSPFPTTSSNQPKIKDWSNRELHNLQHYWNQPLLTVDEIAQMIKRCPIETKRIALELGLEEKTEQQAGNGWCGIKWEFTPEENGDPKNLDPETQRMVAETSATRFSLLYETLEQLEENSKAYREIQNELNKILVLHTRIFEKYLNSKSRKYSQAGQASTVTQVDLEQAGKAAIFECLRRWHPDKKIRFSRGAVCIAITREMITWLEQQRLIELPDKVRTVARKLKQAENLGNMEEEYHRLVEENGKGCVEEAAKHRNTYAFITTVPIMDSYNEEDAEFGGQEAAHMETLCGFETTEAPEDNIDTFKIIMIAAEKLSDPEKRAILAYYGLAEDGTHTGTKTLEEIGEMEGVTKERVRQRIVKGKEKLRRWMEAKGIRTVTDAIGV